MAAVSFIIFGLLAIYATYKYRTIEPKKWRKIKFESFMFWIGFSEGTMDLFTRWKEKVELYPQPHKIAVITGGSQGIGLEVVRKLLKCRIKVIMAVRQPEKCQEIVESSIERPLWKDRISYEKCDVSDMQSVREFAKKVQGEIQSISLLINNAGILSAPHVITKDGFVSQMAVNYFGHFLLSHLLMPQLNAGASEGENSRIVHVGSVVHRIGEIRYDDLEYKNYYRAGMAYADSKLAQIMFTKHMKNICEENSWKVQVHAAHPGVVGTDIFKNTISYSLTKKSVSSWFYKTPEHGSRTIIYTAISKDLEGKNGTYLKDCQIAETYNTANDPIENEKLFKFTCNLLKIKSFGNEV